MTAENPRVLLLDSGVNRRHPHLAGAAINVLATEDFQDDTDRLGHGTCIAAAILDWAPRAVVHSLKIFDDALTAPLNRVVRALQRALIDRHVAAFDLVNLSFGSPSLEAALELEDVVRRLVAAGARLVAPAAIEGLPSYPGLLQGVDAVQADVSLDRRTVRRTDHRGRAFWLGSPFPRDLPGLPRSKNLRGESLACANVTGHLAATWQQPRGGD